MRMNNEVLNRLYIKEPAEKFMTTESTEDMFLLVAHLIVRIRCDGTAPTPIMNNTLIVIGLDPSTELEDVLPPEYEPAELPCLFHFDNESFLPLFTDSSELDEYERTNPIKNMEIRRLVEDAFYNEDIDGILINPYSDAFVIKKEMLAVILQLLGDENFEAF